MSPQNVFLNTRRVLAQLGDLVLPPTCSGCGQVVADAHTLCPDCWGTLTFLGQPCCDACGHPFDFEVPDRTLCGACSREHPPFDSTRAALLYNDASKDFILSFKHADKTDIAQLLAKWLRRAGHDQLAVADMIAPVPLHWTRLFARRYNQAALLANALGQLTGLPVAPDLLIRKRKTPSQGRLGVKARARNVQGAFRVAPKHRLNIKANGCC